LKRQKKRAVFLLASTALVYAPSRRKSAAIEEDRPFRQQRRMDLANSRRSRLVWAYSDEHLRGYVARCFNHIGPGHRKISFVPRWPAASRAPVQVRRFQWATCPPSGNFSDVRDIRTRLPVDHRASSIPKIVCSGLRGTAFPFDVSLTTRGIFWKRNSREDRARPSSPKDPAAFVAKPTLARRYWAGRCRISLDQTLREMYGSAQRSP